MSPTRNYLLCVILTTFVLVGCSRMDTGQARSTVTVTPATPVSVQVSEELPTTEDVQNVSERQLVMLFQGLIVMDRQPSLALTAEQAHAILPIVTKSEEEGSIDESERIEVIQVLSIEQRAYLEEQAKQVKLRISKRMSERKEALSAAERERIVNAFEKKRKLEKQVEAGVSGNENSDASTSPEPRGLGISVEQQLIDLLISKM